MSDMASEKANEATSKRQRFEQYRSLRSNHQVGVARESRGAEGSADVAKKKAKAPKAAKAPVVKPSALEVAVNEGFDAEMILKRTGKESTAAYLEKRLVTLDGKTVTWALTEYKYTDTHGA